MIKIESTQLTKTIRFVVDASLYYNDGEVHFVDVEDHIQPGYEWRRVLLDDYLKPIKTIKDPILLRIKEDLDKEYPVGQVPEQV